MTPAMNPHVHRQRARLLVLPAALAFALTCAALHSALDMMGRPFPSLLVDAYLRYSLVEQPGWTAHSPRVLVGERLVAIGQVPLEPGSPLRNLRRLHSRMSGYLPDESVQLTFQPAVGPPRTVTARVRHFDFRELLFFFITYALAGWMVLWSGALVFTVCGRSAARAAYCSWSVITFLFLTCFYGYHTETWLSPLFSVSTIGVPLGALWLAYAFPEPPRWKVKAWRWLLGAVSLLGAGAALLLVVDAFQGWDLLSVRRFIDWFIVLGLAVLALAVLLRLRYARGHERTELVTASWGLLTTPLLLALIEVYRLLTHKDVLHLALPFIVFLFPLSIGYAMIRNNILQGRVVLTPRMLMVPILLGVVSLSVLTTYVLYLSVEGRNAEFLLSMLLGLALCGLALVLAWRLLLRLFFPATLAFRSTVEGLSDRLASLRDMDTIRRTVEEVVMQVVPTPSAQVLAPEALETQPHLPPDAWEQFSQGRHLWTTHAPREQHLLLPMRSLGELQAVVLVAPKREAALYTQEDIYLLETIASLGALAFHNARVVQELEAFRRLEVSAARDEKRLALGTLATEICHDLGHPLCFLKDLLRRSDSGPALDDEGLLIAREEIGRMERMTASLRRLEWSSPRLEVLPLLPSVDRARLLLREIIQQKKLKVFMHVSPETNVTAEGDSLVQLFSNLLRNAAQAAPEGGEIGISAHGTPSARIIEVWDTGPGIPREVAEVLFTRYVSTKEDGHGIGLTVVHRIARSFNWTVSFHRESHRTLFRLTLPGTP